MKSEIIKIKKIGEPEVNSPLKSKDWVQFVSEEHNIISHLHKKDLDSALKSGEIEFFEIAGPREKIYYRPESLKCGIVTCGGLCPGLNDIIRELVMGLWESYGVKDIAGFRYGYKGIAFPDEIKPLQLTPETVDSIHRDGGTILSSSRGPQNIDKMIDNLVSMGISVLFTIGGDGTMKGAHSIAERAEERGLNISVVAVPKTIDNDICYVKNSFGFETAVEKAADIIDSAHIEAKGAPNCIGLVKLMGRTSGFIASYTALANRNVNYCLIPELPFKLKGRNGFLGVLKERIERKQHAVVVVAEGAGQDLMDDETNQKDASGNVKLKDIGEYLKKEIRDYFKQEKTEINIKYFDPSYIIRSVPANAMDSLHCVHLAQSAAHAALSGRTDMLVSKWNDHYVHVPIPMAVNERKKVNPDGRLWRTVMHATCQPFSMFVKKTRK